MAYTKTDFMIFWLYRFYPSTAKEIADKILADELSNQVYDENEAKDWSLTISDKVRDAVQG